MRDTQIYAWDSIQERLPQTRREVLSVVRDSGKFGITTYSVAEKLRWAINSVSGRITELAEVGIVIDSGRRGVNPSGKKAILWVVNPDNQLTINFK